MIRSAWTWLAVASTTTACAVPDVSFVDASAADSGAEAGDGGADGPADVAQEAMPIVCDASSLVQPATTCCSNGIGCAGVYCAQRCAQCNCAVGELCCATKAMGQLPCRSYAMGCP